MNGPIVCYVLVYALWLQQGYQEFTRVESSVTVKIKGVTKSELGDGTDLDPCKYSENIYVCTTYMQRVRKREGNLGWFHLHSR